MQATKYYPISKELDLEVSYFVTKIDNARFEAQENGDMELLDSSEEKFTALLELEDNLIFKEGCFYVESKYYLLATECKNAYRLRH